MENYKLVLLAIGYAKRIRHSITRPQKLSYKIAKIVVLGLVAVTVLALCSMLFSVDQLGEKKPVYMAIDEGVKYMTPGMDKEKSTIACKGLSLPGFENNGKPSSRHLYTEPLPEQGIPIGASDKFYEQRLERISQGLGNADDQLRQRNNSAYGMKLLPYFKDTSAYGRIIIKTLMNRRYIYFNESIDSSKCMYTNSIRLCRDNPASIDSLLSFSDLNCVGDAIDRLIMDRLKEHKEVSTSFAHIFRYLCKHCSNAEVVASMISECEDVTECRKLFFDRGNYDLSLLSTMILKSLFDKLKQSSQIKYTMIFTGYTDANPVGAIPYTGNALVARNGVLIPAGTNQTRNITLIRSNDELSFIRAAGCYDYLMSYAGLSNVRAFYTGMGVNKSCLNDVQQRAVEIKIVRR
jgi:hypothetical protein